MSWAERTDDDGLAIGRYEIQLYDTTRRGRTVLETFVRYLDCPSKYDPAQWYRVHLPSKRDRRSGSGRDTALIEALDGTGAMILAPGLVVRESALVEILNALCSHDQHEISLNGLKSVVSQRG